METPSIPFSNGTEYEAWAGTWCNYCVHDHNLHADQPGAGCEMMMLAFVGGDNWRWPEAWTPEPPGMFGLPSYMLCGQFTPCTEGACTGAPAPAERAERVTMVRAAWEAAR